MSQNRRRPRGAQMRYLLALVSLSAVACFPAHAQKSARAPGTYPVKPIRLIVPFPPGGANDLLARLLSQKFTERLDQQTVVDNRAGADGIIGSNLAANSPADGYTLLMVSTSYAMNPALHKLPYDPVKSLVPVAILGTGPNVIAASPAVPVKSVKELIALAKARPGQLNYASSGIGGFNHFSGELFNSMAGVKLTHVPFKGGGPAMTDVIAGRVEVLFNTLTPALPHIRSGKLIALGVGGTKRSAAVPDVPTIAEAGVPGYEGSIWWGVLAPAGTPAAVIGKLNSEIAAILREPEIVKRLTADAAEPVIAAPEYFGRLIAADIAKWSRVARETGIKAE